MRPKPFTPIIRPPRNYAPTGNNPSGGRFSVHEGVILEAKDQPRVVEHHIMRDTNIKQKILLPIYNLLKKLKAKNKYNKDVAAKHLYYVVNYAIRDLGQADEKISLSQLEKARVVNDLIRNFEKSFK
jgi:hypothetical protein